MNFKIKVLVYKLVFKALHMIRLAIRCIFYQQVTVICVLYYSIARTHYVQVNYFNRLLYWHYG